MKKTHFLLLLFSLLGTSYVCAQVEEVCDEDVVGPVKQLTILTEVNGSMGSFKSSAGGDDFMYIKRIEQFDNKGHLVHMAHFHGQDLADGYIRQYTDSNTYWEYSYDANRSFKEGDYRRVRLDTAGRKIAEVCYLEGKLFASDSVVYDEKGCKIKLFENSFKKKDSLLLKFTFEYDSLGRLILKHDLLNKARCSYKYLPNGNYIKCYEGKNGNKYETTYTVNKLGQLTKEETKNRRAYFTNYDQYGNWLQLKGETNTNSSLGWFTTITKRTIEYYSPAETDTVYLSSEQLPEFPGGQKAMFQYISNNVIYPLSARKNGTQGRAVCQFVVNKSGDLADIVVVKSSGDNSLDQEAVRVLMSMPKWNPGRSNGEIVRVKYTVPVIFKIVESVPIQKTVEPQENDTTTHVIVDEMPEFPTYHSA